MNFCPLFSGSSGNAAYIQSQQACLLVDAGKSMREIIRALEAIRANGAPLDGILVTHEHTDHTRSVGALSRKYDIPVYANAATFAAMEKTVGNIASRNIRLFNTGQDFYIKDIGIYPYSIPHDASDPVGFCFYGGGKKISIMTDLGYVPPQLLDTVERSNVILIEANHDVTMLQNGPYPQALKRRILGRKGHLSNDAAAKALLELYRSGVGRVILGHLSEHNNTVSRAVETVETYLYRNGVDAEVLVAAQRPGAYRVERAKRRECL